MRAALAAGVAALLLGCSEAPPSRGSAPERAPAVRTVTAERIEVRNVVRGTGSLEARRATDLGPRVDGVIERIEVDVGDRVAAGDLLFRTRPVRYELALEQARHALERARAERRQAEIDLRRAEALHREGALPAERLDRARNRAEIARAAEAGAEVALARARQDLADTEVRSPFAGVVTARYVDEGSLQRTLMSANARVLRVAEIHPLRALLRVPAEHLSRLEVGLPVRLSVQGLEGEFRGEVRAINDQVDAATRSLELRVEVPNPEHRLKPGLFVRGSIDLPPREALVLPREAVLGLPDAPFAWVGDAGSARRRRLVVRELDLTRVEVRGGLEEGEPVLIGPALRELAGGGPPSTGARP